MIKYKTESKSHVKEKDVYWDTSNISSILILQCRHWVRSWDNKTDETPNIVDGIPIKQRGGN